MYVDVRKKEFTANGKMSILKRRPLKMDFQNNLHKNDNDIFEMKKRTIETNHKQLKDDKVDKRIRETSPYLNGKRNSKFTPPHVKSNVVFGDDRTPAKLKPLTAYNRVFAKTKTMTRMSNSALNIISNKNIGNKL